jgi:hypothetical protein
MTANRITELRQRNAALRAARDQPDADQAAINAQQEPLEKELRTRLALNDAAMTAMMFADELPDDE